MKRRFLIFLSVLLLCGLTACGTAQRTPTASDPAGQTTAAAANAVEFARSVRISLPERGGAAPRVLAADSPAAYAQAIAQLQLPPETTESADWQTFAGAAEALLEEAFFEKSALLLVLTEEGCSQSEYETAEYESGALTLLRKNYDPADDGLQDWLTLVALPKDQAPADAADVTVLVRDLDPVPTTKNPLPPAERTTAKPAPKTTPAKDAPDVTYVQGTGAPSAATRKFEKSADGLTLRVLAPEQLPTGKSFALTASIENRSGKAIRYTVPVYSTDAHMQIRVNIGGSSGFTDLDTYQKGFGSAVMELTLKNGETFTETIHFYPGAPLSDGGFADYPAGDYTGSAVFYWQANDGRNSEKQLQLPFSIHLLDAAQQAQESLPRFVRIYPLEYVSFVQPPVTILRSRAELVRFYEANRETLGLGSKMPNAVNPAYGMTQPADATAGFADWMPYYDDAFFADNALILVQTTESSGSYRYRDAQFVNGTVRITVEKPEVCTCDIANWITLLPVPQSALAGVRDDALTVEKPTIKAP